MTSTPSLTLFSDQINTGQSSASLVASAAIHAGMMALVLFGVMAAPQIDRGPSQARLVVRDVTLYTPPSRQQRAERGVPYPGPGRKATPGPQSPRAVLRLAAHAPQGPQTLLQPDLTKALALTERIPVPRVLLWQPAKVVVKHIVPPAPKPLPAAQVHPSLERPSHEIQLADVNLAASRIPSVRLKLLPSSTTPIVQHTPETDAAPAATATPRQATPTAAALLSLSAITLKDGTAVLPPVNETAGLNLPGELAPDAPAGAAKNHAGSSTSSSSIQGKAGEAGRQGIHTGAEAGTQQGSPTGAAGGPPASTHIALPMNGQFGAVVVGDSIQDEFPETAQVWSGRMAYTVYLHVGLARSWILQYAMPASVDAATAGEVTHIDAPWPYSIVRPNLAPDSVNADAILVHGFVGQDGHFHSLAVVFPKAFPQAQFVLQSLDQWQFRPAAENGQHARVEVLLIIPEDLD